MKKTLSLLSALAVGVLLSACSSELDVNSENYVGDKTDTNNEILKGVNVTIEGASYDEKSRASYTVDPMAGFIASWTKGDTIGIYPVGGDQVAFPISDGEGTATAHFDGGAWALRDGRQYAAYYPFSTKNYAIKDTTIPVSYIGQEQDGNNSTAHLAKFDYLGSVATTPESGSIDLQMKHLGAFVRFQLTMPEAATLTSADIESNGVNFTTAGKIDLTQATPVITPTSTATTFSLGLKNITCTAGQVLTLYAMVAPVNLGTANLSLTVNATDGKKYAFKTTGNNIIAGKSYSYTITKLAEEPHEYVDLGLSVKWATYNVGASKPEEYGDYFAWGETVGYNTNKKSFSWSTYKWCNGSSTTMSKYCTSSSYGTVDNKTVLDKEDDAAFVNWGGTWRMPTKEELDELRNTSNCTWTWTAMNGKNGYKVVSKKNGNSIFLPAAGYRDNTPMLAGVFGYYLTSARGANSGYACILQFCSTYERRYDNVDRCVGQSVRAVCP